MPSISALSTKRRNPEKQIQRAVGLQPMARQFLHTEKGETKMKIVEHILKNNSCYKAGKKITVKGLMLHSVGCNQPKASVFLETWNRSGVNACVHAFIDGNDGTVYQTLPWNHRGWHSASGTKGKAHDTHIGVEMCEPACIKYTSGSTFTCSDVATAKAVTKRTYESAVELFAYLCKMYDLDPLADGVIISHKEGHKRGIASNHGDPEHLWNGLGMGYTMNGFRQAVKAAMGGDSSASATTPSKAETVLYYVQAGSYDKKENADAQLKKIKAKGFDACIMPVNGQYKIQVGAYSKKANADAQLAKVKAAGFDAFIASKGGNAEAVTAQKKSVKEVALEVIDGKWGNGEDRKKRLAAAGYNAAEVQKMVNDLLKG